MQLSIEDYALFEKVSAGSVTMQAYLGAMLHKHGKDTFHDMLILANYMKEGRMS